MKLKGIKVSGLVEKDGKLSPARKRYDASTEAKRAGKANEVRPASRKKALSVKGFGSDSVKKADT